MSTVSQFLDDLRHCLPLPEPSQCLSLLALFSSSAFSVSAMASSPKVAKVAEGQSPQQKAEQKAEAAVAAQGSQIAYPVSERILSQMEGTLAVAKEALQFSGDCIEAQEEEQLRTSILSQMLEKLSYIEKRMDSAEAKVTDVLRHISQFLSEFSLSKAMGDQSILRSWLLDQKAAYLKSGLLLGLPEDQVAETFKVLMSLAELKATLEAETNELYALSQCMRGYASKGQAQKVEDEEGYAEAISQTELTLRNMRLSAWRSEVLECSLSSRKPQPGFSVYLQTQIEQGQAMLSKLRALKIRLSEEDKALRIKSPVLSSVFEKMRVEAKNKFMAEESEAEKMGIEIENRARQGAEN